MKTLNYFLNLLNFLKINNILITYTYYHSDSKAPPVDSRTLAEAKLYIDIFFIKLYNFPKLLDFLKTFRLFKTFRLSKKKSNISKYMLSNTCDAKRICRLLGYV